MIDKQFAEDAFNWALNLAALIYKWNPDYKQYVRQQIFLGIEKLFADLSEADRTVLMLHMLLKLVNEGVFENEEISTWTAGLP